MNRGRGGVGLPLPLILQTDRTAVLFPPVVQAPLGSCALDWCPATRGLVSADTALSVNGRRKYPRYAASNVGLATYTIVANAPTFSPGSGTYNAAQTVTIRDDAQRHDLLRHDGLSDDIVAVVHDPVHGVGGDNDYDESYGPGKRSFAKQHHGCGLHNHRPMKRDERNVDRVRGPDRTATALVLLANA